MYYYVNMNQKKNITAIVIGLITVIIIAIIVFNEGITPKRLFIFFSIISLVYLPSFTDLLDYIPLPFFKKKSENKQPEKKIKK